MIWFSLFILWTMRVTGLRVEGIWKPSEQSMRIVTRFAIQPIDPLFPSFTRGFIFGNVTNTAAASSKATSNMALLIIPQIRIHSFEHGDMWHLDCKALLKNISSVLYEPRCFKDGKRGDFMRWISCPENSYCIDETQPDKVIPGFQFTLRIDEPSVSEFWYIVFVSCHLDEGCNWTETISDDDSLKYDIRLTNGHPLLNVDAITKEFSFEEQNVFEIMLFAFACFLVLAIIQWRSTKKSRLRCTPLRSKLLSVVVGLELGGLFLQIMNMIRFIKTGFSVEAVCFLSEFLRNGGECVICFLLLLLGNGWSLHRSGSHLIGSVFYTWTIISIFHMTFFSYGYLLIENQRNYSDLLMLGTARELILIRIVQGLWFLAEIRKTLSAEVNFERAFFLLHFGASFMAWFFTYPILLVAVSLVISEFYRLKFVIATTLFAKFIAVSCLAHIFWPTCSYARFFNSDLMVHRTFSNNSSGGDSEEFDLLMENSMHLDEEPDSPFR